MNGDRQARRAFVERAERLSRAFNARYGVESVWTDDKLDQALADHGLPSLSSLPAEPRGMMANHFKGKLLDGEGHIWQRMNASHLLGHVILHEGTRCAGCEDWGT